MISELFLKMFAPDGDLVEIELFYKGLLDAPTTEVWVLLHQEQVC